MYRVRNLILCELKYITVFSIAPFLIFVNIFGKLAVFKV